MTFLINNLVYSKLITLDLYNPLVYMDLIIALSLVVGFLFYMRKFPSFRVFLGIMLLLGLSVLTFAAGFVLTSIVFGFASTWILLSLPLIFSSEIRHYLGKLGRFHYLRLPRFADTHLKDRFVRNLTDALFELAERSIGGTVVLARKTGLEQTIDTGVLIDALFSSKLLQNIFFPKSPLHDGAVVIKDGKIHAAGCLLPVHGAVKLDPPFGTRHRSGLAITMDTDAVVIMISEQRGEVSLAENGKLEINLPRAQLTERLHHLL